MYFPLSNIIFERESKKMQRGFTIVILERNADALETDIAELFTPIEKKE